MVKSGRVIARLFTVIEFPPSTQRKQDILHRAMDAKYVSLKRITANEVLSAQVNLLGKRKQLFGRLFALRLFFIPVPRFKGFSLFRSWLKLPFFTKIRTVLGTMKRVVQRGLWIHKRDKMSI